ncbi:hypothetical protein HZ994_03045 [Akkermansiaceae bacterium]|nr:hypothetical protein HZ994_03045 [Akkermansiaceae bacterium]
MSSTSSGSWPQDETHATAPQGRRTSSAAESAPGDAATSASRNVGPLVAQVEGLPSRFAAAIQEAKVGYLMPHCAANCGVLKLLESNAARISCFVLAGIARAPGAV